MKEKIHKQTLVRITTVPLSLDKLLEGQLHFMRSYYDVIAVSSDKPYLEKIGRKEGVPVFHLEMTRKITPLQDLRAVWKLYRFLKSTKPHIVHTHTPKAGIVGMMAAKLAGVPNRLHTVAGLPLLESTGTKRKVLDMVEKMTYACASKVYPNSHGLEKIILENKYCDRSKLKVLGNGSSNGIDTNRFSAAHFSSSQITTLKTSLKINEGEFVFIFVGRLVSDKGINELVAAFDSVSRQRAGVKLLLVGPSEDHLDPLDSATLQTIQSNPNIIQAGYQSDVRPYFAISNVLAFPSYREGFPNVVMQAGAMGLPCIVTNINGCNEIISDSQNGLVIPVKNTEQLESAMFKCLDERELFEKMSANSRPQIVAKYEQLTVWEAILAEYRTFGSEN